MSKAPYFFKLDGKDGYYQSIKQSNGYNTLYSCTRTREFIDRLWKIYEEYADVDFLVKARDNDFLSRFWEMYLCNVILRLGFNIEKRIGGISSIEQPDIKIIDNGVTIWIEAVAPSLGGTKIAAHQTEQDEDKISLRLSSSIKDKAVQRDAYIKKGIVQEDDIYIIALSGIKLVHDCISDFAWPPTSNFYPRIVRTLYGLDMPTAEINQDNKILSYGTTYIEYMIKNKTNGCQEKINKNIFLNPKSGFQGISALLYSEIPQIGVNDAFDIDKDFLDYMVFVNNMTAKKPCLGILNKNDYYEKIIKEYIAR